MKFLIILALTLATCFALPGRKEVKSRNVVVPAGRPEGRITRGKDADENQFPYVVGLSMIAKDKKIYRCGGSLVKNKWVLTAAHCTENIVQAIVSLGATDLSSAKVKYRVTRNNFIIHEDYNNVTVKNDIALIKIPYTKFSDEIQPVKLPAKSKSYPSYVGEEVIAAGWGHTSDFSSRPARHLQWARLSVIPNMECARTFPISSSNICTSTVGGVNICDGDSGGPIFLASTKEQIGVISFGASMCTESKPSVYTRLSSFLPWILKHTRNA